VYVKVNAHIVPVPFCTLSARDLRRTPHNNRLQMSESDDEFKHPESNGVQVGHGYQMLSNDDEEEDRSNGNGADNESFGDFVQSVPRTEQVTADATSGDSSTTIAAAVNSTSPATTVNGVGHSRNAEGWTSLPLPSPAVTGPLPDEAYVPFAGNPRGIVSDAELPPRRLDSDMSADDVAAVLDAMKGFTLNYRPSWANSALLGGGGTAAEVQSLTAHVTARQESARALTVPAAPQQPKVTR
jgi:hypothetical protein